MTSTEADVPSLHIESIIAGDCAVLRIAGEIDTGTAHDLRQQVIYLIDNGTVHIVADLRGVNFLDSTGLGVLVGSLKRQIVLKDARDWPQCSDHVPVCVELRV